MAELQNSFIAGKMNKDLDERLIPNGEYRDALNITVSNSEDSNVGSAQNVLGNKGVGSIPSTSNARCIGAVKQEALNLIYWFVASDNYDGIYEYNQLTNVTSRILQASKATPTTPSKLNFSQEFLITGVNYVNGFLYWTDNYNPPRKINISRARSYSINDSRIDDDINVILAPPLNSPKIVLSSDSVDDSNNMDEKFIYFSYRYKYIDGQYSAMSPFSAVAFGPSSFGFDYEKGNNTAMSNIYNQAEIHFETGGKNVTDIQLLFRDVRNLNVSIIENLNKEKYGYSDFTTQSFIFKNNKNYSVITSDQITRLFDNVPLLAKAQDFVGNRLMYGNYTQFFDIKGVDNDDIKIDISLELGSTQATSIDTPIQTFRSDRDYEIGIEYLDRYGRSSTVLTSPNNTVYIPPVYSSTGNSLLVKVKNEPPSWATNFRFLIKQNKGEYYNIFPIVFYSDGLYRYFKINDSDLDKFKVGEYVILKADASNPTFNNKKYKVLEFEQKTAGFLGNNELEGLYFKIKVDNISDIDGGQVQQIGDTGKGAGSVNKGVTSRTRRPVFSGGSSTGRGRSYVELPIHYGDGNPNAITLQSQGYDAPTDQRVTIQIDSPTTYRVYAKNTQTDLSTLGSLIHSGTIVQGTFLALAGIYFNFKFNSSSLVPGDRYIINHRGGQIQNAWSPGQNSAVISLDATEKNVQIKRGAVITLKINTDKFNTYVNTSLQTFTPSPSDYINIEEWWYESGAFNQFTLMSSGGSNLRGRAVTFARGFKGNAYGTNANVPNDFITQQPSDYLTSNMPLNMVISSSIPVNTSYSGNTMPELVVAFTLTQSDNSIIFETEGRSIDNDIFHELSTTYRVEGGYHKVLWSYEDYTVSAGGLTNLGQASPGTTPTSSSVPHKFSVGESVYVNSSDDTYFPSGQYIITSIPDAYNVIVDLAFPGSGPVTEGGISYSQTDTDQSNYSTSPLVVKLNNPGTRNTDYNAWAFGTGLESYRILDDWNEATLEYSMRVNSFVDDYKERHSYNAICYSGIYGENTGVDRLNEFNLSLANFKYLDMDFGSIQRLHARDNDLLVLQQDKISRLLYGKNLLFDAVGGGQVASIPEVLGNQISYPYEYGISNNPESFASWGNELFFTDARRGAVIRIEGDSLEVISRYGMNDYFRDLMRDSPNTQKLGGYDPHLKMYVLSDNEYSVVPCELDLSTNKRSVWKDGERRILFEIQTSQNWTISIEDDGFGTNWVSNSTALSGTGNRVISADIATNNTGAIRTLRYVVTYCIDKTATFTLTQGTGNRTEVVNVVFVNDTVGIQTKGIYE